MVVDLVVVDRWRQSESVYSNLESAETGLRIIAGISHGGGTPDATNRQKSVVASSSCLTNGNVDRVLRIAPFGRPKSRLCCVTACYWLIVH
jgi:hypothetical protein